ncbi:MAG: hypothetical protein AB3N07_03955 [Ruegeria sp.]
MMDTEILEMLEDIGRSSVARLSPAIYLNGETAQARRDQVLTAIRRTILPRRLEFVAANDARLAIEVSSSRITDVFECDTDPLPDFETETRDDLTVKLARILSDIAIAPGPLKLASLRPDAAVQADDVGLTFSEVESACAQIELADEPRMAIVPKASEEPAPEQVDQTGAAQSFYDGADRFALGRFLVNDSDSSALKSDDLCAPEQAAHPSHDLLRRFTRDLAGWVNDSDTALPQLIVMRPSGGQGSALALVRDGAHTAGAIHDARKLGAVVNLWQSLKDAAE